jgi:hypothetical protein
MMIDTTTKVAIKTYIERTGNPVASVSIPNPLMLNRNFSIRPNSLIRVIFLKCLQRTKFNSWWNLKQDKKRPAKCQPKVHVVILVRGNSDRFRAVLGVNDLFEPSGRYDLQTYYVPSFSVIYPVDSISSHFGPFTG